MGCQCIDHVVIHPTVEANEKKKTKNEKTKTKTKQLLMQKHDSNKLYNFIEENTNPIELESISGST